MRAYNDRSMRRGMAIAAFSLILAVPLLAQHGGGHSGGFGGGHSVGSSGSHFSGGGFAGRGVSAGPGARSFSGPGVSRGSSHLPPTFGFRHPPTGGFTPPTSPLVHQSFASNAFGRGSFVRRGFGQNGFGHNRFHRGGIRVHIHSTFPFWSWGYPYWGWGFFDPWWSWWDTEDNGYDNSDYDNNLATANQMNEDNLREQQMLRQEQTDGDQDAYQGAYNQGYEDGQAQNQQDRSNQYADVRPPLDPERMQQAQRSQEQTADSTMRPTVLVFRDQHKQEVQNYAIVGDTLWDFALGGTLRIPLSNLDIPATIKANQDRGVTFSVPDEYGEGG